MSDLAAALLILPVMIALVVVLECIRDLCRGSRYGTAWISQPSPNPVTGTDFSRPLTPAVGQVCAASGGGATFRTVLGSFYM